MLGKVSQLGGYCGSAKCDVVSVLILRRSLRQRSDGRPRLGSAVHLRNETRK